MYQKEGLGSDRATVERRRRQAVGGTNKRSGGASDSTVRRFKIQSAKLVYNKNISYVFVYIFPRNDAWPLFFVYMREYLGYVSYLIGA